MDNPFYTAIFVVAICYIILKILPRFLAGVPFIEPQEALERTMNENNTFIVDVRSAKEFAEFHAPNSIHLETTDLIEQLPQKGIQKESTIFILCLTSQRSIIAAKLLSKNDYKKVGIIKGGLMRWKKEKLPLNG